MEHTTQLGYNVKETSYGLDVYKDEKFVCELLGFSLANFSYNGEVNDDELENYIKDEIECNELCNEFLENMKGL